MGSGKPMHKIITVDFNIKAMAVMDAGLRSCESGSSEKVNTEIISDKKD